MGNVLRSKVPFYQSRRSQLVPALAHASITHSSEALGWTGLHLEVGTNLGCHVDEIMVDGHFVGMQLLDEPMEVDIRVDGRWISRVLPSHSMWIHPEGIPFSTRHARDSRWAGMVIDGAYFDAVAGGHYELIGNYAAEDAVLSSLILGLVGLVSHPQRAVAEDLPLARSMIETLIKALARMHGRPARPVHPGGIAPHQLSQLLDWIEANLEENLTVEALAQRVGLSSAHFSRAFKRSTGSTPWAHVLDRRLLLARTLLQKGEKAADVAYRCKFSDHSHMCRAMRARFGTSPSALVRYK